MSTETETPRVCFQCLAAYNDGRLHFKWFDATGDEDELWEAIREVLRTSPVPGAEEWMIADYEGFGPWRLSENETIAHVARVAEGIEEHGWPFAAWVSNDDSVLRGYDSYHELSEAFGEAYRGEWESEEEYAREFVSDCGLPGVGILTIQGRDPEWARTEAPRWSDTLDQLDSLLDWDKITDSVMESFFTYENGGKTYVFDAN